MLLTEKICSIENCELKVRCKGLCQKHYNRWWKTGSTNLTKIQENSCLVNACIFQVFKQNLCKTHYLFLSNIVKNNNSEFCSVNNCSEKHVARKLCIFHYQRFKETGSVEKSDFNKNRKYFAEDEIGKQYGFLKILDFYDPRVINGVKIPCKALVKCIYNNCQTEPRVILHFTLINHTSRSCGCLRPIKHGLSEHIYYSTCMNIFRRCNNQESEDYKNYGYRGISSFWSKDDIPEMICYLESLGSRPEGYSLDRIDNDGNYEPGNLKWASDEEQVHHRRRQITNYEHSCIISNYEDKIKNLEEEIMQLKSKPVDFEK